MRTYTWGHAIRFGSPVVTWQIVCPHIWQRFVLAGTGTHCTSDQWFDLRSLALADAVLRAPHWLRAAPLFLRTRPEAMLRIDLQQHPAPPVHAADWVESVYLPQVLPGVLLTIERAVLATADALARVQARRPSPQSRQ